MSLQTSETFFRRQWAQFLRENFRTPEHIGVCFGVSRQCAENWLSERSCPRAPYVLHILRDPERGPAARRALGID